MPIRCDQSMQPKIDESTKRQQPHFRVIRKKAIRFQRQLRMPLEDTELDVKTF